MTSEEYKNICSKVSTFRVSDLEDTLSLLQQKRSSEASIVATAISQGTVEKPAKHKGSSISEFCVVTCTLEEATSIVDFLIEAEASAVSKTGQSTAAAGRFADLVNKWASFRSSL
ncbi:hypothetical protein PVT68_01435 [Microbulbifer bruguierae]|uniref:Uncharacterized protein n=1 Tax=Microbulbifer bruguierae TaxID=3029061 RepID=A0ABY8NDG9_9GAMM|nr:hypothetical protein [Microbulbifer bruguierae]WGL16976.1 hypothetical protein PVT68_01435 [Microbulbifer bruguierae]